MEYNSKTKPTAAPPATRARDMTLNEADQLINKLVDTLVKSGGYPYATGFLKSILSSMLSGRSTAEDLIEIINGYIKLGGTK